MGPHFMLLPLIYVFEFEYLSGLHTLSGRIGKVVASHAAVARSICAEVALIYTVHARGVQGVLPMRVGGATSQFINRL